MLRNYFKIAYRNLLKNKVFSFVNIFGLAIGMAACFFIYEYVRFESSYDRFHKKVADLYRVNISFAGSFGSNAGMSTNHPATGPAMKADFPEVVDFARVVSPSIFMSASTVSYTDSQSNTITFNQEKLYVADASFLTMFSFPFVAGDPAQALSEGKSIVISQTMAHKYFGKENPLGKTVSLNRRLPLKVTGIFRDVPENSHIKFDMLVSFKTMGDKWGDDNWGWPEFYTYVMLAPGTDPKKLEAKLPPFIDKYLGDKMKELNFRTFFHLQPIADIHLKSDKIKGPEATGSEREVYFLSIIGIFILVIAWINYINLSTAKSVERAKEVGLRKVVGAMRIQLTVQFIIESVIINFLALALAMLIVVVCFPYFGSYIGKNISQGTLSSGLEHTPGFWLALVGIFLAGAFAVGSYPALVLSAYKPSLVLKGNFFRSDKGIFLRKTLVGFQFVLSILLIAGTITVYRQLSFMQKESLGYNKDQIVVVKAPPVFDSTFAYKINSFKTRLLNNPFIIDVATSSDIPGKTMTGRNSVRKASEDKTHNFITYITEVDEHFTQTYQMPLAAGRNFVRQDTSDTYRAGNKTRVLVNERIVKALGYKNDEAALHQNIIFGYGPGEVNGEIIGVLKNYHQRSLKEAYDPILYVYPSSNNWTYFSINVKTDHLQQNMSSIQDLYKGVFSGNPFEYFFLNEYFDRQYASDQQFGKVFGLFTVLAIFVACLGLLGLSSFVVRLRTKEIGIRKVLGASIASLLILFTRDFVKLVFFATIIALPVIYFMVNRWLGNYAFHIQLSWLIFVIPPVLLLAISLITISLQSIRTALANPVKSLKTD
ncbi:MAG TPA: ABC transporter permease [Puia sp.]|nr:ABC transporter permease [Puia sp.]